MKNTDVSLEVALPARSYAIKIGSGILGGLGRFLRQRSPARRATVITDANVKPLYGKTVWKSLEDADFSVGLFAVPAGDASKSLDVARGLYDQLATARHGRDEPVIALGGGMVGDLAGFVAATWLRGVPFVQCPTTLEADVDASVGGKTALNHPDGKNLIGAFHQPVLVCIDVDCLATLSPRDFTAGLAESVKHAVIGDSAFFEWHNQNAHAIVGREAAATIELIRRNCQIKAAVVVADERETDANGVGRAALNFGHTIGHALESQSGYDLRHGEAVALGMVAEMELAAKCAGFSREEQAKVESLLKSLGLPIRANSPLNVPDLLDRLGLDKKVRQQAVRFVVPTRIGEVRWLESPNDDDIKNAVGRLAST